MIWRTVRTLALSLLLPLLLAGCKQEYAWHQEIRLTVTTPDGPVSAASVQAVEARFFGGGGVPLSPGIEVNYDLRGEAVVVDLGEAGVLFALLSSPELAERAYRDLGRRPQVYEQLQDLAGQPPRPLPEDLRPRLVTFGDVDDPTSVALVDPDDLAATFGAGYALEAVTIAVTDAPVTEGGVERVLEWLHDPTYRTNPVWRSLDNLVQETISALVVPAGGMSR